MAFALAPEALAAGYRLAAHETIGSTSSDAMDRVRGGEPGPLWVASAHQTQGRGRRGSAWQTEPGNLAASLALTTSAEPAVVATLGFVAGVALVQALERVCPPPGEEARVAPEARAGAGGAQDEAPQARHSRPAPHPARAAPESTLSAKGRAETPFSLKWPNDVLADGSKLAGILLETESLGQLRAVVIGIGVNVAHAPTGLPYPAASLRALGRGPTAEDLFAALSAEWIRSYAAWDEGRGFGAIRSLWLARAAGIGGPISVRSGAGVVAGTFETIDERGQLVLRTGAGEVRTVTAGEVYFGSAATARQEAAA